MSLVNITPVKDIIPGTNILIGLETDRAINISSDSVGTAVPTLTASATANFFVLVSDAAMYIRTATTQNHAAAVAIGDTLIPASTPVIIANHGISYIAKKDK